MKAPMQLEFCDFENKDKNQIATGIFWHFYFPLPDLSLSLPLWIIPTMNFTIPSSPLALQAKLFEGYSDTNKGTTSVPRGCLAF